MILGSMPSDVQVPDVRSDVGVPDSRTANVWRSIRRDERDRGRPELGGRPRGGRRVIEGRSAPGVNAEGG